MIMAKRYMLLEDWIDTLETPMSPAMARILIKQKRLDAMKNRFGYWEVWVGQKDPRGPVGRPSIAQRRASGKVVTHE